MRPEIAVNLLNKYLALQNISSKISLSDTSWQEGIRLCSEAIQYGKVLRRAEQYDEGLALAEASHTIENFFRTKRDDETRLQQARLSASPRVEEHKEVPKPSVVQFTPKVKPSAPPRVEEHKEAPKPPSYLESMGVTYTQEQVLAAIAVINTVIQAHLTLAMILTANIIENEKAISIAISDAFRAARKLGASEISRRREITAAGKLIHEVIETVKSNSPPSSPKLVATF